MNIIECRGLEKNYGRIKAVNGLDLNLQAGDPIALIGPNGAGKTTLLSLLSGFIKPSAGEARILGYAPGSKKLIGRLSALPQDAQFDPAFKVMEQLKLFAGLQGMSTQQAKHDAQRVLDLVGMASAAGHKAGELSHGMRKRVALAQALIGSPELVLLDEPTAGIDPPNVKIIRDLIRAQSHLTTFLISSHNLDELEKLCSTVVHLNQGSLVQSGQIEDHDDQGFLTLSAPSLPAEQFIEACSKLTGVVGVERLAQGNFLINCDPGSATDEAVLKLIREKRWKYRHLINGRSLEERLYG